MTNQATYTADTPLSALAEKAVATDAWWQEDKLDQHNELELPTRVLVALANAGIHTVEQLRAAGPHRLRELPHVGKLGFQQIIGCLRALDRQNGGGSHG